MSRPMRRTWEGVLVLLFASKSLAGMTPITPVREDVFVDAQIDTSQTPANEEIIAPIAFKPAADAPTPTIDDLAAEVFSDRFEPFPDAISMRLPHPRLASAEEQPALEATAVPLPPALWPGAITLAGVALAMVIRQHRRA